MICCISFMFDGVCSKAASEAVIYESVRFRIINAQNGYLVTIIKPAIHPPRMLHLRGNTAMMPSIIPVVRLVIQPALRARAADKGAHCAILGDVTVPCSTDKVENVVVVIVIDV